LIVYKYPGIWLDESLCIFHVVLYFDFFISINIIKSV
jgi:hypothetical protein